MILYVVSLTVAWCWMVGSFSVANILGGVAVGSAVLLFLRYANPRSTAYFPSLKQVWKGAGLAAFFIYELVLANFRLAIELVRWRHSMKPGIVAVPLDATSNAEITLTAILVALTPGTLPIDISQDRKVMFVHGTNIEDEARFIRDIKSGFEAKVLGLLR